MNNEKILEDIEFINMNVYYIGTNNYSFRPNEPARILKIYNIKPKGLKERPCFKIKYADGKIDYCPIEDHLNYKIISGNDIVRSSYRLKEKIIND